MLAPESINVLYHFPACTVIVGQSTMHVTVIVSFMGDPPFMGCTTKTGLT